MTQLRIATFNVLHGQPASGTGAEPATLQAALATLDADIVGLQELDCHQPRSGHADQLALVGEALGAPYRCFVPVLHGIQEHVIQHHTERRSARPPGQTRRTRSVTPAGVGGGVTSSMTISEPLSAPDLSGSDLTGKPAYGIGLVSRLPVLSWQTLTFPPAPLRMPLRVPGQRGLVRVPDEPRAAVAAVIDGPSGPFTVINAHLSFVPGWNVSQLRRIRRWAARMPGPRLLIGDFNLPGGLPATITGWRQLARTATYPSYRPRVQFDHVLVDESHQVKVNSAEALRLPVSDHCALVVDLEL